MNITIEIKRGGDIGHPVADALEQRETPLKKPFPETDKL